MVSFSSCVTFTTGRSWSETTTNFLDKVIIMIHVLSSNVKNYQIVAYSFSIPK